MNALETQRVAHLEAARILLQQLRASGTRWSDGRTVHRGESLEQLRSETLARIIGLKDRDTLSRRGPVMYRLCKNIDKLPGVMKQQEGEDVPTWLVRLLSEHSMRNDTGSRERAKAVRRLLRRVAPEALEQLHMSIRYSPSEVSWIRRSRREHLWVLSQDYAIEDLGLVLRAGTAVQPTSAGFATIGIEETEIIPDAFVRKSKRRLNEDKAWAA